MESCVFHKTLDIIIEERISFVCIMVLLLFTSHLALSSSARLRFIEAQDLVHGKQNNLLKLNEIEKADRTRLDYLFGVIT
uniref:Uncharacterized protein n=1 Tax=Brassica oleracea var. oleracea TaxID=109376 RepID=A0A0D3D5M7_BRAOL